MSDVKVEHLGKIVFLPYASGSKSDSLRPFLVRPDVLPLRLHYNGSNPFKEDELFKCADKFSKVIGYKDEKQNVFLVSSVEFVSDGKNI